jgi:hypothetical protein
MRACTAGEVPDLVVVAALERIHRLLTQWWSAFVTRTVQCRMPRLKRERVGRAHGLEALLRGAAYIGCLSAIPTGSFGVTRSGLRMSVQGRAPSSIGAILVAREPPSPRSAQQAG